jgi:hypothetical protein
MGSDATAARAPSETVASNRPWMIPERTTLGESGKAAVTVCPTESEIAAVAYRLWLDSACPIGSDREDWFRAEAVLKDALIAKCECPSSGASISRSDACTESQMLVAFRWEGHWEAWEREWGDARWIWDVNTPGVGVSNRAG